MSWCILPSFYVTKKYHQIPPIFSGALPGAGPESLGGILKRGSLAEMLGTRSTIATMEVAMEVVMVLAMLLMT